MAVDAPSGFADWIYSKKPDIIITDLLITHQHFDHVEDACRMRQIFDCRIHAGQPYNESLTAGKNGPRRLGASPQCSAVCGG